MKTKHEVLKLDPEGILPEIDVQFVTLRSSVPKGIEYLIDIVDFKNKKLDRWTVPFIYINGAKDTIKNVIYKDKKLPFNYTDYLEYYVSQFQTPHICQLSPQGILFMSFGVTDVGFASLILDTNTGSTKLIQGKNEHRLHSSGGDFNEDYTKWYFTCWPPTNKKKHVRINPAETWVCSIDLNTLEEECEAHIVDKVDNGIFLDAIPQQHHHMSISADERFIVATSFENAPIIPFPDCTPEEDPEGFKRTHEAGMRLEGLLTIDLATNKYWNTPIPIPSVGHVEYDLDDPYVGYVSAHNICAITQGTILEGPAGIFKFKIFDGHTEIIGAYTNDHLFRITQHSVFKYEGETLLGVTVTPNKLVLIKAEDMSLWREFELFPAEPIKIEGCGVIDYKHPHGAYSLNPSKDGRYIVLESSLDFYIYDLKENCILEERVSRQVPEGYAGEGHTRSLGM